MGKENFKILADKKALQVKVDGQIYYFDMSDWTSKYGKPMELFLALHLSTMMPDLTYDLATSQAFNTKVTIDFQTVKSTYKIKYNGYDQETILRQYYRMITGGSTSASGDELFDLIKEARKSKDKIKAEDWDILGTAFADLEDEDRSNTERKVNKIIDLIEDGRKERELYWPRITEVTKHWYYDTITFEYGRAKAGVKTIIFSPEDSTNPLYGAELEMETTMTSTQGFFYQLTEPERKGPNEAIVALFKGGTVDGIKFPGEYYRYDGSKDRAQKINNARAVDNGGKEYLFAGKTYKTESASVFKEPVVFYDVDNKNSNKNAYTAFAMLEKAHSEEAEVSYRCLKELLIKLEYFTEEELQDPVTQVLKWILPDMEEKDRKKNVGKDANLYGLVISNASGQNIIAPGDGTVIEADGDSVTVEFGKLNSGVKATLKDKYHIKDKTGGTSGEDDEIQLYKIDENIIVGLQMVIVGINPSVSKGQTISADQSLGTATGEKVQVYFKRADGSIVDEMEKYIDVYNENFKKE